jgi:hypothetical protein
MSVKEENVPIKQENVALKRERKDEDDEGDLEFILERPVKRRFTMDEVKDLIDLRL